MKSIDTVLVFIYAKACKCKWIHENWLLKLEPLLYSFSEFRTRRKKQTKRKKKQEKQKEKKEKSKTEELTQSRVTSGDNFIFFKHLIFF